MAQKDNHQFYKYSIKKYGISPKGVQWNSKYTQYKRFEILTSFIQKEIKNSSIVDAGCGFADYYEYLSKNDLIPKSYIGIDCEQSMINLASKRFINLDFYVKNILEDNLFQTDYYICSGAMNILEKEEIFIFIQKCFKASRTAFIFNFLVNDPLTKVKIEDILEFCKQLTSNIEIKENYLDNDITILLKK